MRTALIDSEKIELHLPLLHRNPERIVHLHGALTVHFGTGWRALPTNAEVVNEQARCSLRIECAIVDEEE